MVWVKRGHLFAPSGAQPWARAYAAFPTPELLSSGDVRVHYTALDDRQQGRSAHVDLAGDDLGRIVATVEQPTLELGEMGHFDESGANIFSVVQWQGRRLAYYQGWQHTRKAPYLIFTGVAEWDAAGARWHPLSRVPVLDRSADEPTMRAAPCVLNLGDHLRMWYVSCLRWRMVDGVPRYHVLIRTASSRDGVSWQTDPTVCIEPAGEEYAVGRPWVLPTADGFEMWFSIRSADRPYRLGHARSPDGIHWLRNDAAAGLPVASARGWDSEMLCYPAVIDRDAQRFLFYNGNRHGHSGFGYAQWQAD